MHSLQGAPPGLAANAPPPSVAPRFTSNLSLPTPSMRLAHGILHTRRALAGDPLALAEKARPGEAPGEVGGLLAVGGELVPLKVGYGNHAVPDALDALGLHLAVVAHLLRPLHEALLVPRGQKELAPVGPQPLEDEVGVHLPVVHRVVSLVLHIHQLQHRLDRKVHVALVLRPVRRQHRPHVLALGLGGVTVGHGVELAVLDKPLDPAARPRLDRPAAPLERRDDALVHGGGVLRIVQGDVALVGKLEESALVGEARDLVEPQAARSPAARRPLKVAEVEVERQLAAQRRRMELLAVGCGLLLDRNTMGRKVRRSCTRCRLGEGQGHGAEERQGILEQGGEVVGGRVEGHRECRNAPVALRRGVRVQGAGSK
mmetsp:Transcript_14857/g.37223  ORF Transcript_14857/g.37223 Transcript_14857/m.37223 type:complete len:372 (-) Transcript_14857:356-1471(-)